ncbi:inactive pancreatic lipase-related protein 1-like [Pseudoliparis swirei]|uniref:inactive pancreatic lipase-related protein 1-like n=1 Tax=Pseudoliparis swirei TaxID=2059687 RepID=UPI0024BDA8E5|nr:inactive pancreatic lipase-related protein 1-like [Pseudoliparis swirei]
MMAHLWILLCFLAGTSYASEVCFNELGCFANQPPWGGTAQRPAAVLPWQPEAIGTRFLLFTPKNRYYQEIKTDESVAVSNYGSARKTRFIIPGYLKAGDEDWPQEMCRVMLKWENWNCIAVEWKKGVKAPYAQAANNARVVAAQVASMITFLMVNEQQTADKFSIIGHSIGAHAAGDVGTRIPGLTRITGLDPAEPYFQDTDAAVRLDISDAAFVDVIHTDATPFKSNLGLGMSQSVGHIDFYPNGGELMPGCSANKGTPTDLDALWQGTKKFDTCNHVRAYEYYSESILTKQGFVGFPCSDKDSFDAGKCFPCAGNACPLMGHSADKFLVTDGPSKTKYFLNTGSSKPFSRYSYKVKLTLEGRKWPNPAFMYVALTGKRHSTQELKLHTGTMIPGKTYEKILDAEVDVGVVKEVKFRWNNYIINFLNPKYGASKVELQRGKDKEIFYFCGTVRVEENEIQAVLPCQD